MHTVMLPCWLRCHTALSDHLVTMPCQTTLSQCNVWLPCHNALSHCLVTLSCQTSLSHSLVRPPSYTAMSDLLVTLPCQTTLSHCLVTLPCHTTLSHCLITLPCHTAVLHCGVPPYAAHRCHLVLVLVVHPRLQLNTFQVVLATDGSRSIAVFNYAEDGINWAGGAVAGYNVGDGDRYFELPGSLSEDIQYIDNMTGNTGRQGQWLFLLDGGFNIQWQDYYIVILYVLVYIVY